MPRPRRPVLAAICAVLLLATVGLWVRSHRHWDTVCFAGRERMIWASTEVGGWAVGNARARREPLGLSFETRDGGGVGHWWFSLTSGDGWIIRGPLWVIVAVLAGSLRWSWRGRKAGAGFPVEPAAGESK